MTLTGLATAFHKAALQFASTNPHRRHWWRGSLRQVCSGSRTLGARRWIEPISHNRSLPSRVQFQHFPGIETRNRSFEGDDQFSAVSVGSAAVADIGRPKMLAPYPTFTPVA